MMNFNREAKIGMRSDIYDAYYKDIRNEQPLSTEEEQNLLYRIKNGDEKARAELIKANTKYVVKVARTYATKDNLMELIQCGNYGMMVALDSYDMDAKTASGAPIRFITWAHYFIMREIYTYLSHDGETVHRPNGQKLFGRISKISEEFLQTEQRMPSEDELIKKLEEKDIHIKDRSDVYDMSYTSINAMTEDEDETSTFDKSKYFNEKTANENSYVQNAETDYNAMLVNRILSAFKEREQTIIKMLFGIGYEREYSIVEVADALNLSSERVRQIKESSLTKMKKVAAQIMRHAI